VERASLADLLCFCASQASGLVKLAELTSDEPSPDDANIIGLARETARELDYLLRIAKPRFDASRTDLIGLYDEPPKPIGSIRAESYHDLAFKIAQDVYFGVFKAADALEGLLNRDAEPDPAKVEENWPAVRQYLVDEAIQFDTGWLFSMVQDEETRAQRRLSEIGETTGKERVEDDTRLAPAGGHLILDQKKHEHRTAISSGRPSKITRHSDLGGKRGRVHR
jgi:hypothetical protein